ncbi:hypothetical protein EDD68_103215 [Melghiribacillus thermohalophilus]|uniref:Spore coat protein W n=1 Tax=Melghiribacillus thermohalophilus TaxID=1324956 RepID=A0A4R3NAH6_9BACI|nr:hypothetical protein [Melghiribacillus thermohalophilus]TCT25660.1 hypothetical protein EDD68_103215 [Melghiribacillus thermohalophilus]
MGNRNNDISEKTLNMLVDSVLNRHGVKLSRARISPREKQQLRRLINDLRRNVDALNRTQRS